MVAALNGVNVADSFQKHKRTCFPNEYSLSRNYGQRIDHIVAQQALLDGSGPLRITDFDVLQGFGGGRRQCSDHCPLWLTLEHSEDAHPSNLRDRIAAELGVYTAQFLTAEAKRVEIDQSP